MPQVIRDLEDAVDEFARTDRWVEGSEGLVAALKSEGFDFKTLAAQVMLKEAASRGERGTVREFLKAGVPLEPISESKPQQTSQRIPFEYRGWLDAACVHADVLRMLIAAGGEQE